MNLVLGAALFVAVGTLAYLLMVLRADVKRCALLVSHLVDLPLARSLGDGGHLAEWTGDDDNELNDWPGEAVIQPGLPAPPQLQDAGDGRWMLAVLTNKAEVPNVLPEGEQLQRVASRYRLVVAAPSTLESSDMQALPDVHAVALPEAMLDGIPGPAVAMVDPDGTVQGVGPVTSSVEMLGFIADGEHQGFGPQDGLHVAVGVLPLVDSGHK